MTTPYDERNSPNECEDCTLYDEHLEICPAGSWKSGYPDFNRCPAVGFIRECERCKMPIGMFRADIPNNQTACDSDGNVVYCCSTKCAEAMKNRFLMDDERDFLERTKGDESICCLTCKKATSYLLNNPHAICSFSNHKESQYLLCWVKKT